MSFVAALIALLLDQIRPPAHARLAEHAVAAWVGTVLHWGDTGKPTQVRWLAFAAVLLPAAAAWTIEWLLFTINPVLSWLWVIAVLYVALGFRQFSHGFTTVKQALEARDLAAAQSAYVAWIGQPLTATVNPDPDANALAQAAAAHGILRTHRNVLAPLFAFALLPGVGGVVLYRVVELCAARRVPASDAFSQTCERMFYYFDSVLSRISGAGFCVVGHFEEAAAAWRTWGTRGASSTAWLYAVSFGALAVRTEPLSAPQAEGQTAEFDPAAAEGVQVIGFDVAQLPQVVGLLWRSVVMWMGLYALVQFTALVS